MKIYLYVTVLYGIVNPVLAVIILMKARRNVVSQFYAYCVFAVVTLGTIWFLQTKPLEKTTAAVLLQTSAFLYSMFPFFFLHFMLVFLRRYEIANSRKIIVATYFAGFFCYVLVLLKLIPLPFSSMSGANTSAFVYFITWMSMLFAVGVALLYSLIEGFREHAMQSNLLFIAFALLMLLLPTPFTQSVFSVISDDSQMLYFGSSMLSLAIIVYLVFRHKITANTPYQAMKSSLAAMNDVIVKTDIDFGIDLIQGAVKPLLGYDQADLLRKNLLEFVSQPGPLREYRELVLGGKQKGFFFDADFICSNGETLQMELSLTPVYGSEEVIGFVGVGRNISERKRAEEALGRSEARYRLLFENNPSPMWAYDLSSHQILLVNGAAVRQYGYTKEQFQGIQLEDILPPDTLQPGETLYGNHRKRDGTCFDAETISWDIDFEGHQVRIALVNDITERNRAEEALKVSEERYRRFFQETITGYICCTPDGIVKECNPSFARILGFATTEDALGSSIRTMYPSTRDYDSMARRLSKNGKLINVEAELVRVDGKSIYVIETVIAGFSNTGELAELRIYIFDITERKTLEDELRQAQKMENLGSLAGGIAHDFNNILAIVSLNASLLSMMKPLDEKILRNVEALKEAGKRGAGLAGQLLTFARKKDVNFEQVNINDVVGEMVKLLGPTFPKTISIHQSLAPDLPKILADGSQLQQVLMNICVNARDAIASGGDLTITTSVLQRDQVRKKFHDATEEEYVCLSVTDSGTGMDEATRARIFEPFFTTKAIGKGTGLGLSVVYGIVRNHRAHIEVDSEIGKGTTFRVYFCAQKKNHDKDGGALPSQETITGGDETILYVEDEDMIMAPLRDLLEQYGYKVLVAQDGVEAVAVFTEHKDDIGIVLTDMGLPKMNGWEAFRQMRQINPNIRAIVASGNFDLTKKEEMIQGGVSRLIQKPYIPEEVLKALRSVLDTEYVIQAK